MSKVIPEYEIGYIAYAHSESLDASSVLSLFNDPAIEFPKYIAKTQDIAETITKHLSPNNSSSMVLLKVLYNPSGPEFGILEAFWKNKASEDYNTIHFPSQSVSINGENRLVAQKDGSGLESLFTTTKQTDNEETPFLPSTQPGTILYMSYASEQLPNNAKRKPEKAFQNSNAIWYAAASEEEAKQKALKSKDHAKTLLTQKVMVNDNQTYSILEKSIAIKKLEVPEDLSKLTIEKTATLIENLQRFKNSGVEAEKLVKSEMLKLISHLRKLNENNKSQKGKIYDKIISEIKRLHKTENKLGYQTASAKIMIWVQLICKLQNTVDASPEQLTAIIAEWKYGRNNNQDLVKFGSIHFSDNKGHLRSEKATRMEVIQHQRHSLFSLFKSKTATEKAVEQIEKIAMAPAA